MEYQGRRIRVLLVFPNVKKAIQQYLDTRHVRLTNVTASELSYGLEEVTAVAKLLDADRLFGEDATIYNLLESLRQGCDIVWLITHANEDGWFLADGMVSASETTALIRSCGAFLTVMNTCSSVEVAELAAKEIGSAFICTVREVPDRTAFITGVLFAQKLSAGYDYTEAFDLTKPGQNSTYKLIPARRDMPPVSDRSGYIDPETLIRLVKSMEDFDIIVNGSPRLGAPGIKTSISNLQVKVDKMSKDLDGLKIQASFMLWIFGAAILLLSLSTLFLVLYKTS